MGKTYRFEINSSHNTEICRLFCQGVLGPLLFPKREKSAELPKDYEKQPSRSSLEERVRFGRKYKKLLTGKP